MYNKNPATRVINIPAQFLPLIKKEAERRGCFSLHECMGQVLSEYFGTDGREKPDQDHPGEVIKGVPLHD